MTRCGFLVSIFLFASTAHAEDKTVAKLSLANGENFPAIDVWVTRAAGKDGSLVVKLIAKGVGAKPQALTIYQCGGDDDGAGDAEVRGIKASAFDLPGGKKGVRVDLVYRLPDGKKKDEQTDTTLVGFGGGKTHKLLELRTRLAHDRSKVCRESEEIALALEGDALAASRSLKLDSALGDDDLPLDKSCKSPRGVAKKLYKWANEKFVDPDDAPAAPDGGTPDSDD